MKQESVEKLLSLALDEDKPESRDLPFEVGDKFLIRTVTYFCTGQIKAIKGNFLILKDAAWIANTGSFRDAIAKGVLDEVEAVDEMVVNLSSIVDAFPWKHALPRESK